MGTMAPSGVTHPQHSSSSVHTRVTSLSSGLLVFLGSHSADLNYCKHHSLRGLWGQVCVCCCDNGQGAAMHRGPCLAHSGAPGTMEPCTLEMIRTGHRTVVAPVGALDHSGGWGLSVPWPGGIRFGNPAGRLLRNSVTEHSCRVLSADAADLHLKQNCLWKQPVPGPSGAPEV